MGVISYSLDQYRLPVFEVSDARYRALGAWITGEIGNSMQSTLDALAIVDDVANDREAEEWSSENYDVTIDRSGMSFTNQWSESETGHYSLAEFRKAIEDYWKWQTSLPPNPQLVREYWPELPRPQAEVLLWEKVWKRQHPYRGRLF